MFGHIIRRPEDISRQFVFIATNEGRFYAHRTDFSNINTVVEWQKISDKDEVSFELGENLVGKCAKNIYLINKY